MITNEMINHKEREKTQKIMEAAIRKHAKAKVGGWTFPGGARYFGEVDSESFPNGRGVLTTNAGEMIAGRYLQDEGRFIRDGREK